MSTVSTNKLQEVARRIKEMREIDGISTEQMAAKTEVSLEDYLAYESGNKDFPFSFIHKCSLIFGIGITDLLEGQSAHLSSYTVTRKGEGQDTAKENGIEIKSLAPLFRKKIAEPYWVKYDFDEKLQNEPINLATHSGQEFDLVLSGKLKVQVGDNIEYLSEGDSIYYNSSTPHGMVAVDGEDCLFVAVVLPGEDTAETIVRETLAPSSIKKELVAAKFIDTVEDENGGLLSIDFKDEDNFNFAFDIVDAIAKRSPNKLAMLHIDKNKIERRFTFKDMKRASNMAANYFKSLGIKKGDRVMLVLKRHYQFWFAILGLHKLGAIAIPATNLLQQHDLDYRFNAAGVSAIVCTADGDVANQVDLAESSSPTLKTKIMVGGNREGWHNFDDEYKLFSAHYYRTDDTPCGDDTMLMFFTSGTTGYPKIAAHSYKYPLGHYITAKYWHGVHEDGLHFTISETGWGKALWGKLYGQWLCEGAVFTYDFDRFDASDILPMFAKYNITTFCAPPTMLRMMVKEDITKYDLSSIKHMTTAGEALNLEIYRQFEKITGLKIMEGFGQTELTLTIANLIGTNCKPGSMGKPVPLYDIDLIDSDGNPVPDGKPGEIVVKTSEKVPCGLFLGYYNDDEKTKEVWHDGYYHTGDVAWRDEDGFFWYVGRADDVIKSSGYRIGPFEIESVIMELPYVLECGVSAAPDEIRGQVVKASIVLVKGTTPSDELKKEIQTYVKEHTAPYKYPRIVEFKDELPKTISGKIQRNKL
ncbi:MAG: AMP-binding protein [Clostridia bacterium]|nr:AMP-binding protein [Clostridia bacterium]MBQ2387378.1 AMP-binding protein [Clostridia bacterium]MBQ2421070.1 AMP-binding protein [Clostridia bacterium]MBQ5598311.1 AMP-binding protein [Clostridia bacterium]